MRSLLERGLVDELRLLVHPLVVGQGAKLFPDGSPPVSLELADSKTFSTGVLDLTYRPVAAHERPPDRALAGRHADRVRRRRRRAGGDPRRRRVQLPPLQELAAARRAARAAVHRRQLRPARARRQRRRAGVRGRARDRGPRARSSRRRAEPRTCSACRPAACSPCGRPRRASRFERAVVYQPPFSVDASGHLPPADFEQRLDELVASGDRGATVGYFMREGMGAPRALVGALRLARPIWRNLEAVVAHAPVRLRGDERHRPRNAARARAVGVDRDADARRRRRQEPGVASQRGGRARAAACRTRRAARFAGQSHNLSMKVLAPVLEDYLLDRR